MDQPISAAAAGTKPPCCSRIATHFVMHSSQICADAPATRRPTASALRPQKEQRRRRGCRRSKLPSVARRSMRLLPLIRREGGLAGSWPCSYARAGRFSTHGRQLLVLLVELLAGDLLFAHLGQFQDEVDDLLLEQWRPHAGERGRVLAVVVPDFLLTAG